MERITYKNEENGFLVIKIKSKESTDLVTVTGYLSGVNVGSVLTLYGEWEKSKNYGRQFKVEKYEEALPASIYGIEKYLGSGLIAGIGPRYAKKIVSLFGKETLTIIEEQPEKLLEIEGIGIQKINKIKESWEEHKSIKKIMAFLQDLEVNTYYAAKIYKEYGDNSIEKIKENPYCLADDIWGIGFKTSDLIAQKLEKDNESYARCRAAVIYTLGKEADKGHCYQDFYDLAKKISKNLDIDEAKILITEDDMMLRNEIISENKNRERIYLPALYQSEKGTAYLIKKIMNRKEKKLIKFYFTKSGAEYDESQKEAIKSAVESKFMILTGGPGTGKTTTIKGIIECFIQNDMKIILAAPTGRAAKRLNEATGLEVKTIHRLLEYKYPGVCTKNENNKLKGDVIIVDESSMIDIFLMYNLLKAIPPEMKVIMAGDADQLPSVGPGNVLNDIIQSKTVPVIKLEKIYRQVGKSDIIKNAHRINCGEYPEFKNILKDDKYFLIIIQK